MTINAVVTQGTQTNAAVSPQQNISATNYQEVIASRATVVQGIQTSAKVTPQQNILVTNYQVSLGNITVGDLTDVVEGNLQDGSLLIYDASTQVWRARTSIDNPNTEVNGGFF
jgi:aromatic ring-cleaving dioxygenase